MVRQNDENQYGSSDYDGGVGLCIYRIGFCFACISVILGFISMCNIENYGLYCGLLIALSGIISGLCLSGLGKIVMNTDELVRIAKEKIIK